MRINQTTLCTPRTLFSLLVTLVIVACQPRTTVLHPADLYNPAAKASYYLAQMEQSQGTLRNTWQLLVARALLQQGELAQAEQQLALLKNAPLDAVQTNEHTLLSAEIAFKKHADVQSNKLLNQLPLVQLATSQQQRYYHLQQAIAQIQQQPLAQMHALIALHPLLPQHAQQNNIDHIWQLLTQLDPNTVTALATRTDNTILQGWLALFICYQTQHNDQKSLRDGIAHWRTQYRTHPAVRKLPAAVLYKLNAQPMVIRKVGLMLPMSGPYALSGNAIQQGFITAINHPTSKTSSQQAALTNDATLAALHEHVVIIPGVVTYDTAAHSLQTIVEQAVKEEISILVGPLLKQDVAQISQLKTNIPILALNIPTESLQHNTICHYGLVAQDEAKASAQRLWQQKKENPLILAPNTPLGQQIAAAFNQTWQQHTNRNAAVGYFASMKELKQVINQKYNREEEYDTLITTVTQTLGLAQQEETSLEPLSTIDAIYLFATPEEAIMLKSILDMITESRANKPALYASSRIFQSNTGPDFRLEMEGLQFSDIPLLITDHNPPIYQRAAALFNNDYSLIRLYAMGMDAWLLVQNFTKLQQLPNFELFGATGILSADGQCIIHRKPSWTRYYQGQHVAVP